MEYYGYIYCTTNLINGMIYIGQKKGKVEKTKGYYGSGVWFSRSIKKHGKENFKKEILCYCKNKDELNEQEINYVAYYREKEYLMYNLADGGHDSCCTGRTLTEEHKKIISEANKNKIVSLETKKRMSLANKGENNSMYGKTGVLHHSYGKKRTKETIEKIRETKTGVPVHTKESRKKLSDANSGENNYWYGKKGNLHPKYGTPSPMKDKHHTEKAKNKISLAMRGENHPNFGKNIWVGKENPFYGKKHTDESKKKMTESRTGEKNHMYGKTGKNHPLSKEVYQINKYTNKIIKKWDSISDIERELKIKHISEVCNGIAKTAGGFKWKFVK